MAIKSIEVDKKTFQIAYDIINPNKENIIVFLHGWGSNKEIMKQGFAHLFSNYKHLYIDLPGFGKSPNEHILTTQDYGNIIKTFLEKFTIPIAVFGHSFGGKVATLLNPKNLVLLSSAGILEMKSPKTLLTIRMAKIFNIFGLSKVTKLLRSDDVNMMSEVMYATFKNVVDEDFSNSFASHKNNTLIFWGKSDTATTLDSGKTIHNLIQNSSFKSYEGDHYFFLRFANDIEKEVENGIL